MYVLFIPYVIFARYLKDKLKINSLVFQNNQTVLSEMVCRGVVGGRLDFPRNASFASVKVVLWLEEEFNIAFKYVNYENYIYSFNLIFKL